MPTKEELKDRAFAEIDSRAEELISLSKQILANPEPGFREFKTAALVGEQFAAMSVPFRSGLGMTGVRGEIIGGSEGPSMAIMGELDSLIVHEHPHADADTGAAHACGHHCQIAMMLGVTRALMRDDVLPHLGGRILPMAVPAEEYIEIEYRDQLRRDGKIEFLGGKPEFIKLGEFDDVHLGDDDAHHQRAPAKSSCASPAPTTAPSPSGSSSWARGRTPGVHRTWGSTR